MATQTNKQLFSNGFTNLLKEQDQVDVELMASGSNKENAISAHKLVLSARSKVFKKMFESDKGKALTKMETITFSEFKHEELQAFVDFIYSDGSELSEKEMQHAMSLYRAADKYEIPHLGDLCRDALIKSLDSSNALKVLELAEIPFDKALTDAALVVIKTNRNTISTSIEFKTFVVNNPNLTVEIMKVITAIPVNATRYCHSCARYY